MEKITIISPNKIKREQRIKSIKEWADAIIGGTFLVGFFAIMIWLA